VRLADAISWDLFSDVSEREPAVVFGRAHAITCDEVFVDVMRSPGGPRGERGIARVRLDSLGPGNPPD